MLEVLVLFPSSTDASEIDGLLASFIPSISKAQGLRSLRVSTGDLMSRGGPSAYGRVIEMSFDSLANWMAWVLAPERQAQGSSFDLLKPVVLFFEASDPRPAG